MSLQFLHSSPSSEYHLDRLLQYLPNALDKMYERMLCSIDNSSSQKARRILTMLSFASRPLTVSELIDGIAVKIKDADGLDRTQRLQDANGIRRITPGLVEIDHDTSARTEKKLTQTVRLAHSTVQQYLESDLMQHQKAAFFRLSSATAHAEISEICLLYLLEPALATTPLTQTILEEYPLADYAAEFWYYHYQRAEYRSEVNELMLRYVQRWHSLDGRPRVDTSYSGSAQS
jgi:hypothetical protein